MNSTDIQIALSKIHTQDFFLTECKNGPTWDMHYLRMDAVAIKKSWIRPCVTIYEVKVSRNDFLRDSKWPGYLEYCNRFYFACPKGLINPADIEDPRVGLVWVNENGSVITKKQIPARATDIPEEFFKHILFSRIESDRTPFFSEREEYVKAYLENKKSARALGVLVSSKMIERLAEMEENLSDLSKQTENSEAYRELVEALRERGIYWVKTEEIVEAMTQKRDVVRLVNFVTRFVEYSKEIEEVLKEVKV